ncbi:MAG: peptidoglycan editing factor PgeF [Clostridia bacterium]|nr:peptidoglycan editing factor PgeF [Clostridia bacterium]
MCLSEINGIHLNQSEVLLKFKSLVHGFTARTGGVSEGEYKSLSLSPHRGDDIECVRENEKILCKALGFDHKRLTSTCQEHTDNIKIIEKEHIGYGISSLWDEGVDGIITQLKEVPLICYSADCVPILFFASDIEAIGAVHSGWRGTDKRIAEKTVKKIIDMGADARNIYAAIGPCIGICCYEVSEDVAKNFERVYYKEKTGGKYMLDLGKINFDLINKCGVPKDNISLSGICTKCRNDIFFSHRAQNGKSGTLGGIICMR